MTAHTLSRADRSSAAARLRLPERATAVALLVLLHAALFYLINPKFGHYREAPTEITLSLNAPKSTEPPPRAINPTFIRPNAPAIPPPSITEPNVPLPPSAPAPDVSGIGRSLFNCDLANGKNLSSEQRANCLHIGPAPPAAGTMEAGMPKASKAKQSALWAAQLEARKTPPTVPCTSLQQEVLGGPGLQKQTTTLMADPLCLLNGLLNGFQPQGK